jgi:hypothetical protein
MAGPCLAPGTSTSPAYWPAMRAYWRVFMPGAGLNELPSTFE